MTIQSRALSFAAVAVATLTAFVAGSALAADPYQSCDQAVFTYKYPGEGSVGERFSGDQWWRINPENAPSEVRPGAESSAIPANTTARNPVRNCSNADYVCTRTERRVFAVPRGDLKDGARFLAEGAEVVNEGCLQRVGDQCVTALFTSDCRERNTSRSSPRVWGEISGSDCRAVSHGLKYLYVYNRDRGVIAYEEAEWWVPGTDHSRWDLSTLGVSAELLALVESRGLLSCH